MDSMNVVVYKKDTREVLACVNLQGEETILKKGIETEIFSGVEPVFIERQNGTICLGENTIIVNPDFMKE